MNPTFDERIGANIRNLRNAKNLSQRALGDSLSTTITFQQVQKFEKGINRISIQTAQEFANALECPLIALLKGIKSYDQELRDIARWLNNTGCDKSVSIAVANLAEMLDKTKP